MHYLGIYIQFILVQIQSECFFFVLFRFVLALRFHFGFFLFGGTRAAHVAFTFKRAHCRCAHTEHTYYQAIRNAFENLIWWMDKIEFCPVKQTELNDFKQNGKKEIRKCKEIKTEQSKKRQKESECRTTNECISHARPTNWITLTTLCVCVQLLNICDAIHLMRPCACAHFCLVLFCR